MANRSASHQSLSDLPSDLPRFLRQDRPTLVHSFNYLENLQRQRLTEQYENPEKESEWSRLTGDHIAYRNRYVNVEPFANNRIVLNVAEGFNDYINASPIALGPRRYVATQGPKNTSTSQFYRMLAQESTNDSAIVVVMLTQTHEAGREKCFKYFPDSQDTPLELHPDPDLDDGKPDAYVSCLTFANFCSQDSRAQLNLYRLKRTPHAAVPSVTCACATGIHQLNKKKKMTSGTKRKSNTCSLSAGQTSRSLKARTATPCSISSKSLPL